MKVLIVTKDNRVFYATLRGKGATLSETVYEIKSSCANRLPARLFVANDATLAGIFFELNSFVVSCSKEEVLDLDRSKVFECTGLVSAKIESFIERKLTDDDDDDDYDDDDDDREMKELKCIVVSNESLIYYGTIEKIEGNIVALENIRLFLCDAPWAAEEIAANGLAEWSALAVYPNVLIKNAYIPFTKLFICTNEVVEKIEKFIKLKLGEVK